ncbi:MAG TPA: T9SS type A sorting domain-containing protein [Bacteroidia bacterium]|jgi:hypothetical protein|nr:T9SS type A sorting domain-containing protein [Bacteroidia bacterium]
MKPRIILKITLLLAFCLMQSIYTLKAQSYKFSKSYNIYTHSDFEQTSEMVLAFDSNYVIAFNSYDSALHEYTIELIKFDTSGHHLWHYSFPSSEQVFDTKIAQCLDSGFVITSTYSSASDTTERIIMIKTDLSGNEQWVKLLGDRTLSQENCDVQINGSYIFMLSRGGVKISTNNYAPDYFIAKIDMNGRVIWYNKYNFIGNPYPKSFVVTPKNQIFVEAEIYPNGNSQFALSKIDTSGNLIWSKIYSPYRDIEPLNMILASHGDLIMTGHIWTTNSRLWDILLMKVDSSGNFKWAKTYGGNSWDEGWFVFQLKSGYVICAEPESFNNNSRTSLMKTDTIGNLLWMKLYGPLGTFPNGAVQLNNGFAIYGINGSPGAYAPIYLIRTDTNGSTVCTRTSATFPDSSFTLSPRDTGTSGVVHGDSTFYLPENADSLTESDNCETITAMKNVPNHAEEIILFPNPNTGKFTIALNISESNPLLEVYNIFGNRVYSANLKHVQGDNTIDISQPSGVYLYRILGENGELIKEGKFIIQK